MRRSPCGERGLKFAARCTIGKAQRSLPVRGAWIEIQQCQRGEKSTPSLPVRGAWIEIFAIRPPWLPSPSLPVRGAWIEINHITGQALLVVVAPRAGSVD